MKHAKTDYALNTTLRNAAIIELLFATGLRVSELCSLSAQYIDLGNGTFASWGKGVKERILQIGNQDVLAIFQRYAEENAVRIHKTGYFLLIGCCQEFPNSLFAFW